MDFEIVVGMVGEQTTSVTEAKTARHLGSGGLLTYATPAMVSLMEGAAVATIDPHLPEGYASVGIKLTISHIAATPIGKQVRAEAEVIGIDRRRVEFKVTAWDEVEKIGVGTHARFIIDVERFQQRLQDKM